MAEVRESIFLSLRTEFVHNDNLFPGIGHGVSRGVLCGSVTCAKGLRGGRAASATRGRSVFALTRRLRLPSHSRSHSRWDTGRLDNGFLMMLTLTPVERFFRAIYLSQARATILYREEATLLVVVRLLANLRKILSTGDPRLPPPPFSLPFSPLPLGGTRFPIFGHNGHN